MPGVHAHCATAMNKCNTRNISKRLYRVCIHNTAFTKHISTRKKQTNKKDGAIKKTQKGVEKPFVPSTQSKGRRVLSTKLPRSERDSHKWLTPPTRQRYACKGHKVGEVNFEERKGQEAINSHSQRAVTRHVLKV